MRPNIWLTKFGSKSRKDIIITLSSHHRIIMCRIDEINISAMFARTFYALIPHSVMYELVIFSFLA